MSQALDREAPIPRSGRRTMLRPRGAVLVAFYIAVAGVALLPVFLVDVPPLVDYPNHLARMHILAHRDEIPALQQIYDIDWSLHPNMAMDLIVPLLARSMSVFAAGKLFVAASMLSLLVGTLVLRKALIGRVGLWPVLAILLLYNAALFWGFLNYLFTAGLALMAFGAWIALRDRSVWLRGTVFPCLTFALYAGHLMGLFVYGILVFGYEAWRWRQKPAAASGGVAEWAPSVAQFVLPAALFLNWSAGKPADAPAINEYGALAVKLAALVSPASFGLPFVDIPTVAFLGIAIVACRSSPSVGLTPAVRLPLLLLALCAVVMPNYLMSVWGVDLRLPMIVGCVLIAGTRFDSGSERLEFGLVAAAIFLVILRVGAVSNSWSQFDADFKEFRERIAVLEPGTTLLVVEDPADLPEGKLPSHSNSYWHMAALAVIDRAVFLPTLFTGHTAIRAAPAYQIIDTQVGTPLTRRQLLADAIPHVPTGHRLNRFYRAYWSGWSDHFDYVLVIRFGNLSNPDPERLRRRLRGSYFDLYRVLKPSRPGP